MKRVLKVPMIAIALLLFGAVQNKSSAQVSVSVSFQTFYDELSPYGQWIDYPEYGYVWSPDDRYSNFHPYRSAGRWTWSEYGWLWVSDYDWGWAPFHYGRWVYDSWHGWLWVPDYEWGPAWVQWRSGGDYYGWAPMGPGISISLSFGRYNPPYNYWSFAPSRYINYSGISNYCLDYNRNTTIINKTTIINNYNRTNNYVMGPSVNDVERYTRSRISPVRLRETQRAGRTIERSNELSIYRPYINRGADKGSPKNFEEYRQRSGGTTYRTNSERQQNTSTQNRNTRIERPYQNRGTQRIERQPVPNTNDQRIERQQAPERNNTRIERPYQNRGRQVERQPAPRENQRIERQQVPQNDQRIERRQAPERNNPQIERPYQNRGRQIERQPVPQGNQRIERQQSPGQNSQRIERQQAPNQNSQRIERPYQNRGQQPQAQPQAPQQRDNGNGNGRGRGRGNN